MDNFDLRKYLAEGRLLKEELRDVEDILVKAGFRFDDGILGGVGSGGAGYYDNAIVTGKHFLKSKLSIYFNF